MKLLFIYNANSGKVSAALDIAHKLFSPSTYQCQLCSLTHATLSERSEWTAFKNKTDVEMIFYHKDEFEKVYAQSYEYPVILEESAQGLRVFMEKNGIKSQKNTSALISSLTQLINQRQ